MRFGLSSMSAPRVSARELAQLVWSVGGSCVDLRVDRGHGWEAGDFAAELEAIDIAFVGTSIEVGGTTPLNGQLLSASVLELVRARSLPVRCFLPRGPLDDAGSRLARDDIGRVQDLVEGAPIVIELHRDTPGLAETERLLATSPARAVVDTLGSRRAGASWPEISRFAKDWALAVQVKGFDDTGRHLPLAAANDVLTATLDMVSAVPDVPVTVETKAGSGLDDLRLLRACRQSGGQAGA